MDVIYPYQATPIAIHIIILVIAALGVLMGIFFIKRRPVPLSQGIVDNIHERLDKVERKQQ
jgi:hypothetical protein